jgi:predicted amidohydrolase YtcJ
MKLIIRGKHIWGFDDSCDSVLIEDDHIESVGDWNDLSSPDITTHNYRDCMILPGFTDAHLHMEWLGKILCGCDLRGVTTLDDLTSKLSEYANTLPDDDWLIGYGLNERKWSQSVKLSRDLIDSACGNHPAILCRVDGHSWLINSQLIIQSGVNRVRDNDLEAHIQKDEENNPTGIIYDKAYEELISHLLPKDDISKIRNRLQVAQKQLLSQGITSCRSFGSQDVLMTLADMEQKNLIKMRVCACIPKDSLDWAVSISTKTGNGSDNLWIGQLKLFLDGSLGSQSALVSKPYIDGSYGLSLLEYDDLRMLIEKAHSHSIGVATHAIGDVAVARAVKAFTDCNSTKADTIEHFQCANFESISRIAKTDVGIVLNPSHISLDQSSIEQQWSSLKNWVYPMASLINAGARVGFGSDAPVSTANPLYAIASATSRRDRDPDTGTVNIKEAVPFNVALQIASKGSAEIIGGPKRGVIENSYKADITIISDDMRGKMPWDINLSSFVATYVNGERVWQA